MKFKVDIQNVIDDDSFPDRFHIQRWVNETLDSEIDQAELCLRVVDAIEIQNLNLRFRHKDTPTNVLSFPAELPEELFKQKPFLGDIILCSEVIQREAEEQGKLLEAHWAHMIIHGILHLLGYDHIDDKDAETMEALEIKLLDKFGYTNPYQAVEDKHD